MERWVWTFRGGHIISWRRYSQQWPGMYWIFIWWSQCNFWDLCWKLCNPKLSAKVRLEKPNNFVNQENLHLTCVFTNHSWSLYSQVPIDSAELQRTPKQPKTAGDVWRYERSCLLCFINRLSSSVDPENWYSTKQDDGKQRFPGENCAKFLFHGHTLHTSLEQIQSIPGQNQRDPINSLWMVQRFPSIRDS